MRGRCQEGTAVGGEMDSRLARNKRSEWFSTQKQKILMCNGEKCLCAGYETNIIFIKARKRTTVGALVELVFVSSQLRVSTSNADIPGPTVQNGSGLLTSSFPPQATIIQINGSFTIRNTEY